MSHEQTVSSSLKDGLPPGPERRDRPKDASSQIQSVQALRAIAALFVVGFHSTVLWHDDFSQSVKPWQNGNAGVDLFFVISGFIMVLSSRKLLGKPRGWSRFILLRLVRIVPMYWLATAAKLISIAAVPAMALHTFPTVWNTIASFIFVPARNAIGVVSPVLVVGWTLSFEMLFYLVFTSALFFFLDPLLVVGPVMLVVAALSIVRAPDWPAITTLASPIVLEFVFGVVIGRVVLLGALRRASLPWAVAVGIAGLLCLALVPTDGEWSRVAVWGVAAAATLTAAVIAEGALCRFIPRILVRIGESSYSLYLTHGFVLPVIGAILVKAKLTGDVQGIALIVSSIVISTVVGLMLYRFIEVPITAWLRWLVGDRARTNLAAPQTGI